jgi:hypothetical protein
MPQTDVYESCPFCYCIKCLFGRSMRQARDLFKASLLLQNHSWRARANAINWSPGTIKRERRRNTAKCPASWASVRTPVKFVGNAVVSRVGARAACLKGFALFGPVRRDAKLAASESIYQNCHESICQHLSPGNCFLTDGLRPICKPCHLLGISTDEKSPAWGEKQSQAARIKAINMVQDKLKTATTSKHHAFDFAEYGFFACRWCSICSTASSPCQS